MSLFDMGLLDTLPRALPIRKENERPVCSCIDCYVDKNGERRCRCDYCRPALSSIVRKVK